MRWARWRPRPSRLAPPSALLLHELAVELDPPTLAQVLDDVPVQGGDIRAAEMREAGTERDVGRTVDLLVEERVLHVARDARVAPDAELAQPPGALVGVQRLDQELLVGLRRRVDDLAALEPQAHAGELTAGEDRRKLAEPDLAFRRVLDRRREELAARDVRPARVDLHRPSGEPQPEVGPVADDPHLLGGVEPVGIALHALLLGLPVEQARAEEELGELLRRHAGVLREGRRRVLA